MFMPEPYIHLCRNVLSFDTVLLNTDAVLTTGKKICNGFFI